MIYWNMQWICNGTTQGLNGQTNVIMYLKTTSSHIYETNNFGT